ncbi:MAG: hypothetical protein FWG91_10925 [Lachnospiraceae bacterium]|nr:hypothetical protein [Lachnospiraceae bacterium]
MIYLRLFNNKKSIIKLSILVLMVLSFRPIQSFIQQSMEQDYFSNNAIYFLRLSTVITVLSMIIITYIKLCKFKNYSNQSLTLLGFSQMKIYWLAFLKCSDLLIGYVFISCLIYGSINNSASNILWGSICNYILIFIICGYIRSFSFFIKPLIILSGLLYVIGFGIAGFSFVIAKEILFADWFNIFFAWYYGMGLNLAKIFMIPLLIPLVQMEKNPWLCAKEKIKKRKFLGDFIHKYCNAIEIISIYRRMLRNFEFIAWKIFSSTLVIFTMIYLESTHVLVGLFLVINLVQFFYSYDIYKIEVRNIHIYQFSNMSYRSFIIKQIIKNLFIKQDILWAAFFVYLLRLNYEMVFSLAIIFVLVTMWEICSNIFIYSNYPRKIIPIILVPIFLICNMPLLNIIFAFYYYTKGARNWESAGGMLNAKD